MYVRKIGDGKVKIGFQVARIVDEKELPGAILEIEQEIDVNLRKLAADITSEFAAENDYVEASIDSKGACRLKKAPPEEGAPVDGEEE